jgi:hypothetical protein
MKQTSQVKSSKIKKLITNNPFSIEQRITEKSKTGIFRGYGMAEAPPVFQRLPQERTKLIG